mmetsp:Transcript_31546/g.48229  ORF Transcript_31546/g.48229 Transcript_31546/m.48229 type:complete len:134 (-) Transcript_31546:8-409(-)
MPQNSLTTCIDQAGVYYRVPIACINDPVNYEQNYQYQQLKEKKVPDEQELKDLKIKLMPDKLIQMDISNLISIADLKQIYLQKLKEKEIAGTADLKVAQFRFFCMGKELQDDLFLYSYDIKSDMTIQCMVRKN